MFWFGLCWGIQSDLIPVGNGLNIVKFVLDAPLCPSNSGELMSNPPYTSIHIVLILDCIWTFRNQAVHQGRVVNPLTCIKALELRILEHSNALVIDGAP